MKKRFISFHSAGAFATTVDGQDEVKIVEGVEAFSDDLGYEADERQALDSIEVGERWFSPDYGLYHWVLRIEDNE